MEIPNYQYNRYTVTRPELETLGAFIESRGITSVLEFGSGISSHFLGTLAQTTSLEDKDDCRENTEGLKVAVGSSDFRVLKWSGKDDIPVEDYKVGMIFIDGPVDTAYGHYGRAGAFMAARRFIDKGLCDSVWMHDGWEHHCIDMAVSHLAPVCFQAAYPKWVRPNEFFYGASMILWEKI